MSCSLKKKRARAFNSQRGKCYYCGVPMWLNDIGCHPLQSRISAAAVKRLRCTAEHLVARTDGGSDANDNIVAACSFCNQARHRRRKPLNPAGFRVLVKCRMRRGKWHPDEVHQLTAERSHLGQASTETVCPG